MVDKISASDLTKPLYLGKKMDPIILIGYIYGHLFDPRVPSTFAKDCIHCIFIYTVKILKMKSMCGSCRDFSGGNEMHPIKPERLNQKKKSIDISL